jgi:hypothetical protein
MPVIGSRRRDLTAHSSDIVGAMTPPQLEIRIISMNNIIWLVGAVVIVLFILGYFGLR